MKFVFIPLILWTVSQTIKFFVRRSRNEPASISSAAWIYVWGSGAPSTHTALLTATVWIVGRYDHYGAVFGFSVVVALLSIYDIANQRRSQLLLETYFRKSTDPILHDLVRDKRMLDINGHDMSDIFWGALLGFGYGIALTAAGIIP